MPQPQSSHTYDVTIDGVQYEVTSDRELTDAQAYRFAKQQASQPQAEYQPGELASHMTGQAPSTVSDTPAHEPDTYWGGFRKSIGDQIREARTGAIEAMQGPAHPQTARDIAPLLIPGGIEGAMSGARNLAGQLRMAAPEGTSVIRGMKGAVGRLLDPAAQTVEESVSPMGIARQKGPQQYGSAQPVALEPGTAPAPRTPAPILQRPARPSTATGPSPEPVAHGPHPTSPPSWSPRETVLEPGSSPASRTSAPKTARTALAATEGEPAFPVTHGPHPNEATWSLRETILEPGAAPAPRTATPILRAPVRPASIGSSPESVTHGPHPTETPWAPREVVLEPGAVPTSILKRSATPWTPPEPVSSQIPADEPWNRFMQDAIEERGGRPVSIQEDLASPINPASDVVPESSSRIGQPSDPAFEAMLDRAAGVEGGTPKILSTGHGMMPTPTPSDPLGDLLYDARDHWGSKNVPGAAEGEVRTGTPLTEDTQPRGLSAEPATRIGANYLDKMSPAQMIEWYNKIADTGPFKTEAARQIRARGVSLP